MIECGSVGVCGCLRYIACCYNILSPKPTSKTFGSYLGRYKGRAKGYEVPGPGFFRNPALWLGARTS